MLVFGIILLLAGAGCVFVASRTQRKVHAMMAAETLSVPQLEELRAVSDELGGQGSFRKVCEVVGLTHPAPVGVLRSELAGVECVWHSHRVQRRYKHYDRDDDGRTRVTTRTETVAELTSPHGFALIEGGRTIGVDHGGRRPDGVEMVADRFEPAVAEQPQGVLAGALNVLSAVSGGDRDETIGFQHTEWVLRPGTPMYVLGEVHDIHGPLIIAPPADPKTPFVLSTKSEEQLTAKARTTQRIWAFVGLGLAVAGVALLVLSFL
ncbi:MAG: E3 ubiquitin ligase family protein [Pseudonocardia sp.]|nr:E3 ubiquitin ligase family protein [Pseudonocardia sp.]